MFENGWEIGVPDFVFSNDEPFLPSATQDTYRCFSIPYDVGQDRWLRSVDVKPGDSETVHHVIAFLDRAGSSKQLDDKDAGPGYTCFGGPGIRTTEVLTGWAPGNPATVLPDDVGIQLPAKGRIVLQVDYSPHFRQPLSDQTEVGFYFTEGAVGPR